MLGKNGRWTKSACRWILFPLLLPLSCIAGNVRFGSYNSSINVINGAKFNVTNRLDNNGGRVSENLLGGITGNEIIFHNAYWEQGNSEILMTGTYQPQLDQSSTYTLRLAGETELTADRFRASPGTSIEFMSVCGNYNSIEGNPSFRRPIELQDNDTTLTLAIQSVLDANIMMNGGNIILEDHLNLADNVVFTGSGTVVLNNRQLALGGSDLVWTGTTTWTNAQDVAYRTNVDLRGMWIFEGEGFLSGESTLLDLTHGGTIWIKPNSSLIITQVKIKGLGRDPGQGTIIFEDSTSQLIMRRAALEFLTSYTIDQGQVITEVGSTKMIVRDHELWFESPGSLTVEGVNLIYNTRTFPDNKNIKPNRTGGTSPITLNENGRILHFGSFSGFTGDTSESGGLEQNKYLGDSGQGGTLTLINEAPEFDGQGWYIHFARDALDDSSATLKLLYIEDNTDGILYHVVLKAFSTKYLRFGSNSSLAFGDMTTVELESDEDLVETLTFEGECNFDGKGQTLDLSSGNGIELRDNKAKWGKRTSLRFKDVIIKGLSGTSIRCLDNTATITFDNVKLLLADDYTFSTGHFEIFNDTSVHNVSSSDNVTFLFQPDGVASKVLSCGTLHLDKGVTFHYDPIDNSDIVNDQRRLLFDDDKSILSLNQATFHASGIGVRLLKGAMIVDHKCTLNSDGIILNRAIHFGDGNSSSNDFHIDIMPGAELNAASGFVNYDNLSG